MNGIIFDKSTRRFSSECTKVSNRAKAINLAITKGGFFPSGTKMSSKDASRRYRFEPQNPIAAGRFYKKYGRMPSAYDLATSRHSRKIASMR